MDMVHSGLHLAAEHGSIDCVKSLLEYHADVHKTTEPRLENTLHLATWQHDLKLFLKKLSLSQEYVLRGTSRRSEC